MIHRISIAALLLALIASEVDAQNRQYRRRGVILGGLAGAAIGAAIGDKGDNETAGALIGAAAGAVAGGAIGNQKDMRVQDYRRYQSTYRQPTPVPYYQGNRFNNGTRVIPHYSQPHVYDYDPGYQSREATGPSILHNGATGAIVAPGNNTPGAPVAMPSAAPQPVTPEHVLSMVDAGLSDSIVIRQIQRRGVLQDISVNEIIQLHQAGVSEAVISAMQSPSETQADSNVQDQREWRYRTDDQR